LSTKLLKLDDQGEIVKYGGKYIRGDDADKWVSYDVEKSEYVNSSYIRRKVKSTGKLRNQTTFGIEEKDGWFEVVWEVDYQVDPNKPMAYAMGRAEVLVGQFKKLKDAEKFAIETALKMRDIRDKYSYSEVWAERQLRIEELPLFTLKDVLVTNERGETFKEFEQVESDLKITSIVLDMSGVQSKKQDKLDKEEKRKVRLAGGEDTRIMVKILMNVDLQNLEESIADYLQGEVDTIDGVGADSDSTYNVDEVTVKVESTGQIEATFYLERESGKFAGKDELTDALMDQLGKNSTVEVPIEITN